MASVLKVSSAARRVLSVLGSSHSQRCWLSNQSSFNSLPSSCPSSNDKTHLSLRHILESKLEKLLEENERNHDHYSELIFQCAKDRNHTLAMDVFSSMEANGLKPTAAVFNSLILVCFSSGNVFTAMSLFEIMDSSEGFKPDSHTYNIFISAFLNAGKFDSMQAWYSAKKAAGFDSDTGTYELLISGCVKMRNYELADMFYKEMVSSGIVPSLAVLECMLEGLCKRRGSSQVKEFLAMVCGNGWRVSEKMADMVVNLLIRLGMVEPLEELLETLRESDQSSEALSSVYCGIIRMYSVMDRLDDVEDCVGRMLKQGLSFRHADDVEKVMCSYFRLCEYDRLESFLQSIKDSYELSSSTIDLVVAGFNRAGLSDKLNELKLASG